MFLIRLVVLTLVFFVVLNLSRIKNFRRWGDIKVQALIFPFSLALAVTVVDYLLRVAFYYGAIIFLLIAVICFLVLRSLTGGRKR